jgi:hypothetical protein
LVVAGKKEERVAKRDMLLQDGSTAASSRGGVREALLRRLLDGEFPVDRDCRGDLPEEKDSEFDCCSGGSFQVLVGGESGLGRAESCLVTEGGKFGGSSEQSIAARYRLATDGRFLDMINAEIPLVQLYTIQVQYSLAASLLSLYLAYHMQSPLSMLSPAVLCNGSLFHPLCSRYTTHPGSQKRLNTGQRGVEVRCGDKIAKSSSSQFSCSRPMRERAGRKPNAW